MESLPFVSIFEYGHWTPPRVVFPGSQLIDVLHLPKYEEEVFKIWLMTDFLGYYVCMVRRHLLSSVSRCLYYEGARAPFA